MNLSNKFNNAIQISDTDLDGIGAVIVSKVLFPNIEQILPQDRELIDSTLEDIILSGKYNTVLMTDCSPSSESTIKLINKFVEEGNDFVLLDHHKTALDLNKYSWSKVKVETNGVKHCGTELIYNYYKELGIKPEEFGVPDNKLAEFVELVRSYDTWDWAINNLKEAEDLNKLYYFLESPNFVVDMISKIKNNLSLLNKNDYNSLNVIELLDNRYIEDKKNMFQEINYDGMKVAVLFTDRCVSKLGNIICRENPNIDFCCIVDLNRNKCSLRSTKDDINVATIAKKYNGGGHEKASGFSLNSKAKTTLLKNLF